MCSNLELFESVSITIDDIKLWLSCTVPHLSNLRQDYYVKYNDVASKIKLSKSNGSFINLIKPNNDPPPFFSSFITKYKCDPADPVPPCSKIKCYCNLKSCKFNQLIKRRARNRRYYSKKCKLNLIKPV